MGPRRSAVVTSFVAAASLVGLPRDPVEACDSTACAVAMRVSDGPLQTGQWRVDISAREVDQSRRFAFGAAADRVYRPRVDLGSAGFEAASHEELSETMTFVQMEVSRALTSRLTASVTVPLYRRTTIDSLHYIPPDGPVPDIPGHEHPGGVAGTYTPFVNSAQGMGDVQVGLRGSVWSWGPREVGAGLTVKLPTGHSRLVGDDGVIDPMLQPGTGAFDVVGSLQYVQRLPAATVGVTSSFQKATRSSAGYQYGDDLVVAASATRPLSPRVTGQLQLKGQRAGRHHFRDTAVPSTGLTLVQLAPGVRFRVAPALSLYATMQMPVYVRVNDSQLGPRVTLTAGVVKSF
jgi:hypothetical protein